MSFRVDHERHPLRWCRHSVALEGIKKSHVLRWAADSCTLPPRNDDQLLSRKELAYLTRRMALGDPSHVVLAALGRPYSPSIRKIADKIYALLLEKGVVIRANRKMPVLNRGAVDTILSGDRVPDEKIERDGRTKLSRHHVYYMIYLRQVVGLSSIQIERITQRSTVKRILSRYDMWDNPDANVSRNYAQGRKKHRRALRVEWVHPKAAVTSAPIDKDTYRMRVRHYTGVIVARHGTRIENAHLLNSPGYVVDHVLSVIDGFDFNGRQTPWTLLCHPANLRVISAEENNAKGGDSDIAPSTLLRRIDQFSKQHGAVMIPIDTETLNAVSAKYRAMANNRRS